MLASGQKKLSSWVKCDSILCMCVVLYFFLIITTNHYYRGEVIVHKTFHRYVVRAKRGTAQSIHDKQGGFAKSGGATLRRYNEAALKAVSIHNIYLVYLIKQACARNICKCW